MRTNVDALTPEELRASREAWWTDDFDAFLRSAFPGDLAGRILDVGCGVGTLEQRLTPHAAADTVFVGVDVDVPRLHGARRPRAGTFLAADGAGLPFPDRTFDASITVLTLQHVADPVRVLSEMRRATEPGGIVVAVEPDNVGQRLRLPFPSARLEGALDAFWRRVREARRPADIAIGPRLPDLYERAGLAAPALKEYLVVHSSASDPREFRARTRERFLRLARAHGVGETAELDALVAAIDALQPEGPEPFTAVSTVPLFLAAARA